MASRTIWLTGLPGAGKTTLATALRATLQDQGKPCCLLDGDEVRAGLSVDLGFAPEDRLENVRRVAEVAKLLNASGVTAIVAMVSPLQADRHQARQIIGADRFCEVFVDAPLETCVSRDPKGMYKRARSGEIRGFTGLSAPYEPPPRPDVHLHTDALGPQACLIKVLAALP